MKTAAAGAEQVNKGGIMNFKNLIRWSLAKLSVVTMVMMPVAQGHAAEKAQQEISKAMVQNAIVEMGLNKPMTYGEFFKKNKNKYPPRLQKQLAPYFNKFSKVAMPQFIVDTAKGSDGKIYPVLRISQNGELHNVQFFGETERYAKFNNTNLTEVDLINYDDMLVKLSAGDAKLYQQVRTPATATKKPITGLPVITKQAWSKMTTMDRANYIVGMRSLWEESRKVLVEQEKVNSKKGKSRKKFSWLNSLIFQASEAQVPPPPSNITAEEVEYDEDTSTTTPITSATPTTNTCLVAGYISRYTNKGVCSIKNIILEQDPDSVIKKSNDQCKNQGANFYACNPLIYGTPNGQAACINSRSAEFQKATWWQADSGESCDAKSRLTNNQINIAGNIKSRDYYKTAANQAEALALQEQEKENFKLSRDLINGLLQFKGMKALTTKNDPLSADVFEAIKLIQINFNEDIKKARASCSSQVMNKNEKNFWGACDQLHKRFLFIAQVLEQTPSCENAGKDSKLDKDTLLCSCDPASTDGKPVSPGSKCEVKAPPVAPTTCNAACDATKQTCEKEGDKFVCKDKPVVPPVTTQDCDVDCGPGKSCKIKIEEGREIKQCVSVEVTTPGKPPKKKNKLASFFEKALPWLAGAGVIAAMYFLWKPKQPKLKVAGDYCPTGSVPPCGVQCAAPLVFHNGSCSCAACPPGQTITNLNTCQCGVSQNNTNIVCADGVTIVTNISQCPAAQYTCWDGTVVANAINCPERPPAGTSGSSKTTR